MRTLYLVNNTMPYQTNGFTMAYDKLEESIKHVVTTILFDDWFDNLSKKEREEAALEWLIELEVA